LFADELSLSVLIALIIVTLILSASTYYYIERRIVISKLSRICLVVSFLAINVFALWIYHRGGVVRDVPELDIYEGSADPSAFERYTDRVFQYDHEFSPNDSRKKILVIGNSYARDFANILLESPMRDSIQLSYHFVFVDCPLSRIRQCDRIYFFGWKHDIPSEVLHNLKQSADIWGIGTKNHGTSNGIFHKNRYRPDYFAQRTTIREDFHRVNHLLKEEWQDKYVDLLSLTLLLDGTVPVFTSDHHFITYDGLHLTPAGTRNYAKLLFTQEKVD
jgi:hypothetical protein